MTIYDILNSFIYWGKYVKSEQVPSFKRYISEMLRRNRVMVIDGDNGMEALICYFITDDVTKFNNRPLWSCPQDSERGHTIFIDKMVARHWTHALRREVQSSIEKKFPFIEQAYWLREPNNRSVIIKRRRAHELHSQVC